MFKTVKVMLIIAVAGTMVQLAYFITEMIIESRFGGSFGRNADIMKRILVYWLTGAISLTVACKIWEKFEIIALAVGSGGIYLMLLGANGGLWTNTLLWLRMILVAVNLALFIIILYRIDKLGKGETKPKEETEGEE